MSIRRIGNLNHPDKFTRLVTKGTELFSYIPYCRRLGVMSLMFLLIPVAVASAIDEPIDKISFNRDIRPILSDKCFHCHGPDEGTREAELRFDQKEEAFRVIEPGDPESSELISRIMEDDPDIQMPPPDANKPLDKAEMQLIEEWVQQGADWDEFWAYTPPVWHPVAEHASKADWIDRMILQRLRSEGLELSPPANKVTLIRRLFFDLTGLPPSPEDVQQFLVDPSPRAYERVVNKLLDSNQFGERMAMYWLDLVRYADTVGYHGDQPHNIAPYRDWVIRAFNANMPFDQFTREQLAGDLLANTTEQQQVATGYNRLLQTTHEGGLQPKEYRAIYAADRVRNVSVVWMGATLGCAQCHDHKYDPYSAKDFYSMAAFFADIDDERHFKSGTNTLPTSRPPEILILDDQFKAEYQRLKEATEQSRKKKKQLKKSLEKLKQELAKSKSGQCADLEIEVAEAAKNHQVETGQLQALTEQLKQLESKGAWTMITKPLKQPRTVRILERGNWLDESGPVVEPAIPEFMGTLDKGRRLNRLDLANWLTDADGNGGKFTARVFANRLWYLFFGVGIVKSLDDFGGQGEPPVFPELIDNLAIDFARDWDVKRAIRQIVLSQTYQQTSIASQELIRRDPNNQLFARQSRYRLPAEMVRDASLAISGLLNLDEVGGVTSKPYQPKGYYRHLNFPNRKYSHSTDKDQWRRGVYVHWQRQFLLPTFKALDAPSREECTCERPRSNTPLAALALLNDPSFVEAARVFATKIISKSNSDSVEERIQFAFQWAVSRDPEPNETDVLRQLYEGCLSEYQADEAAARKLLEAGQAPLVKVAPMSELAAWTMVSRAILNMSEAISRN